MTARPFMDRTRNVTGFAHGRWDDYSDVADGGLAETEAFEDALQVRKVAQPDGLAVDYRCNDLMPHGFVVEWPELAAIASGMSPSDPRLQINPHWAIAYDESNRPFPNYVGQGSCKCRFPVAIEITREEANRAMMQHKEFVRQDARMPRLYQALKALGAAR